MYKRLSFLLILLVSALATKAQLDTNQVLLGDWNLVYASVGFPFSVDDTNTSYKEVKENKLKMTVDHGSVTFISTTIFEILGDSIVSEECFKLNRKENSLHLKKRKNRRLYFIEKLTFGEVVLTEIAYNTLTFQTIRHRYYFEKETSTKINYPFIGDWVSDDYCNFCPIGKDTMTLFPSSKNLNQYGYIQHLSIEKDKITKATLPTYSTHFSNNEKPDSIETPSALNTSTYSKATKNKWIYDPVTKLLYFYTDYVTQKYLTYKVAECISNEKLVLIKQD